MKVYTKRSVKNFQRLVTITIVVMFIIAGIALGIKGAEYDAQGRGVNVTVVEYCAMGLACSLLAMLIGFGVNNIVLSFFIKQIIKEEQLAYDFNKNEAIAVFPGGYCNWRWRKEYLDLKTIDIPRSFFPQTVTMKLCPITTNPKVRHLVYSVTTDAHDSAQKFIKAMKGAVAANFQDIQSWIKYLLYEFNEEHSRELATLYNPLDSEQQNKLGDMILAYMSSHFEPIGMKIKDVSFQMA